MRFHLLILLCGVLVPDVPILAAEQEPPSVKRIGEATYRVGLVEFDAETREISLPVVVNMREGGPLEYVLVCDFGKTHEAILTTKARPSDIQIALKLLKYQDGPGDIFDRLLPAEDRLIKGDRSAERGDPVDLMIKWQNGGKEEISSINQWIVDGTTIKARGEDGSPMAEHSWHFTGSKISEGKFLGDVEGSIIAIYIDPVSLFNTAIPGAENDERWGANHLVIPEIGTEATLVVIPLKDKIDKP